MKSVNLRFIGMAALCGMVWSGIALGEVSAEKAKELGTTLTPVGAEKTGSKDGLVPAWTPAPIHGPLSGVFPSNPAIESDKPIFTVTGADMAKYVPMLSQGAQYMLKTFPDYKLIVYPSHRTISYPDFIYKSTAKNALTCKLPNVDNPVGCTQGFPFPIPTSGAQPIWNHKIKWRGDDFKRANDQLIVDPDGHFQKTNIVEDVQFLYANSKDPVTLNESAPRYLNYKSHLLSPPRVKGEILLVHESAGVGAHGRQAWIYAPALKRIRRAPSVCCDNPYEGTDGLEFYDQVDMFNGVMDRYTWKLLGKREMIIPYDNFKIVKAKYKDIVRPHHINQDLPRYEVHRVWVVEADLAPGQRHTYAKRVFYIDEDSWDIVEVDDYDGKGQLIVYQEGMSTPYYNIGSGTTSPEVIYHLDSGRYFVTTLQGEGAPYNFAVDYPKGFFDPTQVQQNAN